MRVLPQFIFNSRDPIVIGVSIEAGVLHQGTPLCVPCKGVRARACAVMSVCVCSWCVLMLSVFQFVDIGVVTSIEVNHKSVESAKKGQEICVKIEPIPGESPKMYGRHFEATDTIVSKVRTQGRPRPSAGGRGLPQTRVYFFDHGCSLFFGRHGNTS